MTKKYTLELTQAELFDLEAILDVCEREGWHFGRKDYWDKHLHMIKLQTKWALKQSYIYNENKEKQKLKKEQK